jgi:hypothetical protein
MNTLRVKCIRCGKEWEKTAAFPWGPDDYSSSLCRTCFVKVVSPLIRKKQLSEGNFDCFGKAHAYCDQKMCKYRCWCLKADEPGQQKNSFGTQELVDSPFPQNLPRNPRPDTMERTKAPCI